MSLFGALGLLKQRLTDPELKDFTSPADIFNLLLFVVTFGVCLLHLIVVDPKLYLSMGFVFNLITFNLTAVGAQTHALTTIAVVLLGFTVAYVPLTHMSHFVGKYFAYHAIRWNDEPNLQGSKHEKPIGEVLAYPVSWSGEHIQGNGTKTWADVATDLSSAQEEKK
jgi:nitrate reductase gamma subunit